MQEELNKIINIINSSNWSTDAKIRFVYVELGKLLSKNILFFYTLQGNLDGKDKQNLKLTSEQIGEILNSDEFSDTVVCKITAKMLAYVFDNTGIDYKFMQSARSDTYIDDYGNSVEIPHYFLCVMGANEQKYFLSLNADLANIQAGKKTLHFANDIPYVQRDPKDKKLYKSYLGDEIIHTVLSDEQIEKIDNEIGYLNSYYRVNETHTKNTNVVYPEGIVYNDYLFDKIKDNYSKKNFPNVLSKKTYFYENLVRLINGKCNLLDIYIGNYDKDEELYLDIDFSNKTYDSWNDVFIYVLLETLQKLIDEEKIELSTNDFSKMKNYIAKSNFDEFFTSIRKKIPQKNSSEYFNVGALFSRIEGLMKNVKALYNYIDANGNLQLDTPKKKDEYIKHISFIKKYIDFICQYFVDDLYFISTKSTEPQNNEYVAKKIITSFISIFDIGGKGNLDFHKMKISEKSFILKEILSIVLNDIISDKNIKNFDPRKSSLENRVISSVIMNRETNTYDYLIYIKPLEDPKVEKGKDSVTLIFKLDTNEIKLASLPIVFNEYYVMKDRDLLTYHGESQKR